MSMDAPKEDSGEEMLFATAFEGLGVDASLLVPWEERAQAVEAVRLPSGTGIELMQALWVRDSFMSHLDPQSIGHLEPFFDFVTVPAGRDVIQQNEYGNFMVVLLSGSIAVDRVQPWGERLRLAETRPGEILGEMSLLDSGLRFSSCTTLTECGLAVLSAEAMDDMLQARPVLAAHLVALLARKLSLRLRVVSARLSDSSK